MRRKVLAAALLISGVLATRIGLHGRADGPGTVPEHRDVAPAARSSVEAETPALRPSREDDSLVLLRGNQAWDRIAALERRVGLYRKALGHPSDEWIRLLHLIHISADELRHASPQVVSDADLVFEPGRFAEIQAAAQDLARAAGEYDEAARTRQASSMAALRPAFEEAWAFFRGLVRRNLRR